MFIKKKIFSSQLIMESKPKEALNRRGFPDIFPNVAGQTRREREEALIH